MRLHELAKEMEADSKELLSLAKKLGLAVKSHSSNLAPGETALLRVGFRFRDLDEDELFDRLENLEEEKKAEDEAKGAEEKALKAERAKKLLDEREAEDEAKLRAVEAGEAPPSPVEPFEIEVEEVLDEIPESVEAEAPAAPPVEVVETVVDEVPTVEADGEAEAAPPAEPAKEDTRRGAKILGRIELDQTEVKKAEATHDNLDKSLGTPGTGRRPGARPGTDSDQLRQRKRIPAAGKSKWHVNPEDISPFGYGGDSSSPRFWERMPHLRRAQPAAPRRVMGRRSRGPKKNPLVDKKITVTTPISVSDFSQATGIRASDILGKLLMATKGKLSNLNSMLDEEQIIQLAVDFNRDIETAERKTAEGEFLKDEEAAKPPEEVEAGPDARPPVVVFMGHVDHGKTSLLDQIRAAKVADGESGGITQHISAYQVKTKKGQAVTFLDTPGHRAFTEMRARGANCTDIVVLVVAADDGVMPQTEEALQHARAAGDEMPIVIALNKIDKAEADPLKVKQQLMGMDLLPEEFGGQVAVVETSATTGQGIDDLLDRLALEAEIRELRGDKKKKARAYVLEASKQEGKGVVATILVRDGTLKARDPFLCGNTWGRVRMMEDHEGKSIKKAGPSTPVRVYGFKGEIPAAGDLFMVVDNEKGAEKVVRERLRAVVDGEADERETVTLDNLFASLEADKVHEIKVVLKTDVQGSMEVLTRELAALKHAEVEVRVLRSGVGGITEDDVLLAATSEASIIGFHVTADGKARREADRLGVDLRNYTVIYEILDDLKKAMAGTLKPDESERVVGHAEIRNTFKVSRLGTIAGCYVTDGMIRRSDQIRVVRDGKVIYTSTLDSLKRFKDDVKEVKENFECGLKVVGFDDIKVSDTIEAFEIVYQERELSLSE